jgi:hypothetical protein
VYFAKYFLGKNISWFLLHQGRAREVFYLTEKSVVYSPGDLSLLTLDNR